MFPALPPDVIDAVRRDAKRCLDVIPFPASTVPELYAKLEWAYEYVMESQQPHEGADVYTRWAFYRWVNSKVPAVAKSDYYLDATDLFAPLLRVKAKTKYPKVGKSGVLHVVPVVAQEDGTLAQEVETLCKLGLGCPDRLREALHLLYKAWKRVRAYYAEVDAHWSEGAWALNLDPAQPAFLCFKRKDDEDAGGEDDPE
jgi:hypothetical protein